MTDRPHCLAGTLVLVVAALAMGACSAGDSAGSPEPVTVFAAASLSDALEDIGASYRAMGHEVRFSFAASSTLARQIEAGAPADIFASASEGWMDYLESRGLVDAASRISPIGNALVLIAPGDGARQALPPAPDRGLEHLLVEADRFAMGDPQHVPAGIYAREALQSLGLWQSLERRAAFANDVRGVLALVERGETPLGIVYATDAAISARVRVLATFPDRLHDPIRYSFALVAGRPGEESARLLAFMSGPAALDVFRRRGFVVP